MQATQFVFLPLVLGAALVAQGPTFKLSTATKYGVVAQIGTNEKVSGVAANTAVVQPLALNARNFATNLSANAANSAGLSRFYNQATVHVREHGAVYSNTTTGKALAATIDAGGTDNAAPHTLSFTVTGTTSQNGVVVVSWSAQATPGGSARCAIDLDGDQTPEFTGTANQRPVVKEFPVQAGTSGFAFTITTECAAAIEDVRGGASYSASLSVSFREGSSRTYTVTPFGPECRGKLAGSASMNTLTLNLTNAPASAIGLLVIGDTQGTVELGDCDLLVLPEVIQVFQTDAQGKATHILRLPHMGAFTLFVQDATLEPSGSGFKIGTSNSLKVEVR
ncbi:MAG: hypothetical protein IT458_05925 [Planctomycetes bacterium]|nr:hypothetical protein [Planctomycetota bacterium]